MITKETERKVKEAMVIEDVISVFVKLKKYGNVYKCLSPFNNEKTPSFHVVPTKQIFKCFSSGHAGNAIDFLMLHEKMTYPEAIKWLADKYRIEFVVEGSSNKLEDGEQERNTIKTLNNRAVNAFLYFLERNEEAMRYLNMRGIKNDSHKLWQIGYAPKLNEVSAVFIKNYTPHQLDNAGISKQMDTGEVYDFFRDRIIFPIKSISGQVIAFGGRSMDPNAKPKYINTKENQLYKKAQVLYGLFENKHQISKNNLAYLVEGYTDVISLWQYGVRSAVSTSGTAITGHQIRALKRWTSRISIMTDGDKAGEKATYQAALLCLENEVDPLIVPLPKDQDPDSIAQKLKQDVVNYITRNEEDFILFYARKIKAENNPATKTAEVKNLLKLISASPDPVKRQIYFSSVSSLLNISEHALAHTAMRQETPRKQEEEADVVYNHKSIDIPNGYEKTFISILIEHGDRTVTTPSGSESLADYICSVLLEDNIELNNREYNKIYKLYLDSYQQGVTLTAKSLAISDDADVSQTSAAINADLIHNAITLDEYDIMKTVTEIIKTIQINFLKRKQKAIHESIQDHPERMKELIKESSELAVLIQELQG